MTHLRLAETGRQAAFARLWNRMVNELERAANLTVTEPLLMREDQLMGRHISLRRRVTPGDGGVPVSSDPWRVFQWTPPSGGTPSTYWRNVRVHLGLVNRSSTTGATKVHEQDPGLPTGSPAGSDHDILVPASTTDYKLWGAVTFTRVAPCANQEASIQIDSVAIEHGAAWWTGHPAQYPTAGKFYFEIATVTTGADESPDLTINQIADADQVILPVTVLYATATMTSGNAGGGGANCSYKYKVTDFCGAVLLNDVAPATGRSAGVEYTEGSGLCVVFVDGDGNLRLDRVLNEVIVFEEC